ncbi:DotH/IcmK family type IV secretion protein [Gluconacetobacter diazotrophicus]|nr:DotH/IcmK family type IV secretion protein [Gluconacetobacter diazotrophicus]
MYKRYDNGQRALDGADDPHGLAVPVSRSITIPLTPGAQTNIIRIAKGFPASITFVDDTGQPYPIAWDIMTNKAGGCDPSGQQGGGPNGPSVRAVGISACVPEAGSNVLQLTPVSRYPTGGVLVSLKGAPKPISFLIVAGTGSYDADLTARVLWKGPNAKDAPNPEADMPATGDKVLSDIVDGSPPADAVPLAVSGVSPDRLRAWRYANAIYLRTNYQQVSPAPMASETEYGTHVYRIPPTSRILVEDQDRMIPVKLAEDGP